MQLMSFALTTRQVLKRSKHVTRRIGWRDLKVGRILQPVEKGQGLKKGETVVTVGGPIRVTDVRREPLSRMLEDEAYGRTECIAEGFPDLTPAEFVAMFCASHKVARADARKRYRQAEPGDMVTRIQFEYLEDRNGR